jgi:hypothetical protein
VSTLADEIELHREQTRQFIEYHPTNVVLTRTPYVADGAGGWQEGTPAALDAQRVRIVGMKQGASIVTSDGTRVALEKSLVGMGDFDVEVGDTFQYEGRLFEIIDVQKDPSWRVTAGARRHG